MGKLTERLKNGIVTENPTFVQMLGMCPTLAVTTSAINGLGMGLTTMVILTLSNFMISLLRELSPDKVRIPAYIVIIASFELNSRSYARKFAPKYSYPEYVLLSSFPEEERKDPEKMAELIRTVLTYTDAGSLKELIP